MTDPHLVGRDKDTPQEQRPSPAVLLTVCVSASPIFVFNRELGDGACVRNGGMTFDHFIDQLGKLGFVGPWHFAPNVVNARPGEQFLVVNHGGETHTFTEVDEFGGGISDRLNAIMHLDTVAPECQALDDDDFVAPGQTYREDIEEAGDEKYQCCIHPWMRLTAHVSEKPH